MGACGCGESEPQQVYTVGDFVLGIWEYHGCTYCDTPIGVAVQIYTREVADRYDLLDKITGEFAPGPHGFAEKVVPLVGRRELVAAAEEIEAEEGAVGDEYDGLGEWLADNGLKLLERALRKRP